MGMEQFGADGISAMGGIGGNLGASMRNSMAEVIQREKGIDYNLGS